MYKTNKILIITFFLSTILGCVYNSQNENESLHENHNRKIKLFVNGKSIFIITNIHGISGNHQRIIITADDKRNYQREYDYAFFTSEIYFRINDDKLEVFAPESSILEPDKVDLKNTVNVNLLNNREEIEDYEVNFKKYNLRKVSVYN